MHSVGVVRPADEATGAREEKKNGGKRSKRQRFTAGVGTEAEAKYKKKPRQDGQRHRKPRRHRDECENRKMESEKR